MSCAREGRDTRPELELCLAVTSRVTEGGGPTAPALCVILSRSAVKAASSSRDVLSRADAQARARLCCDYRPPLYAHPRPSSRYRRPSVYLPRRLRCLERTRTHPLRRADARPRSHRHPGCGSLRCRERARVGHVPTARIPSARPPVSIQHAESCPRRWAPPQIRRFLRAPLRHPYPYRCTARAGLAAAARRRFPRAWRAGRPFSPFATLCPRPPTGAFGGALTPRRATRCTRARPRRLTDTAIGRTIFTSLPGGEEGFHLPSLRRSKTASKKNLECA
ncbi:hypothetical protein FB451DRAFT_733622 [Mycena latifolia]|nr:hypothetical protein FB451DRAFT_733622 [Mycena latifolia]